MSGKSEQDLRTPLRRVQRNGSIKAIPTRALAIVRLETLAAGGTRTIIYCTYFFLLLCAILTVVLHLKVDRRVVELESPLCSPSPSPTAAAAAAAVVVDAAPDSTNPSHADSDLAIFGDPRSMGACYRAVSPPGSIEWLGAVTNVDKLAGEFQLSLDIDDPLPPAMASPAPQVLLSATIQGSNSASLKDSDMVLQLVNSTVGVSCTASDGCATILLVDSFAKLQGQGGGGYSTYFLSVTYNANMSTLGTLRYSFGYQLATFRVAFTAVRIVLLCVTVVALIRFVLASRAHTHQMLQWLPQRQWIAMPLLVGLFLWQNPLLAATQLLASVSLPVRVATVASQGVGWAAIFVYWLLIMDSLKYSPHKLPKRFYLWKVVFGVWFCATVVGLELCREASGLFYRDATLSNHQSELILSITVGVGLLFALNLLVWFLWFCWVVWTTRRTLRSLPYAQTRFQQLMYRFLVYQQLAVIAFVVITDAIPLITFLVAYIKNPDQPHETSSSGGSERVNGKAWLANVLQDLGQPYQPLGQLILLSVYSYLMSIVFLPPAQAASESAAAAAAARTDSSTSLEEVEERRGMLGSLAAGAMNAAGVVLGITSGREHAERFNLDTACWLFDFSWAVYFDPPGNDTPSSFGRLTGSIHQFELDAFLYDEATDTAGMVFRRGQRVVAAFRGTASKKNFMTDLKVSRGTVEFGLHRHQFVDTIPGVRETLPLLHSGFWRAYSSIRERCTAAVRSSLASAGSNARLFVTGHSLGGALATIASYDLKPLVHENRKAFAALPGRMRRQMSTPTVKFGKSVSVGRSQGGRRGGGGGGARTVPVRGESPSTVGSSDDERDPLSPSRTGRPDPLDRGQLALTASALHLRRQEDPLLDLGLYDNRKDRRRRPEPGAVIASSHDGARISSGWWTESEPDSPLPWEKSASSLGPGAGAGTGAGAGASARSVSDIDVHESKSGGGRTRRPSSTVDDSILSTEDAADQLGSDAVSGVGHIPRTLDGGSRPNRQLDVMCYTFGQPRVGNRTFASDVNEAIPHLFRVVFDGDFIAGIPKFLWAYKHAGTEAVLDAQGNILVDPSFVERRFRSKSKRSFVAHSMLSYKAGLQAAIAMEQDSGYSPPGLV